VDLLTEKDLLVAISFGRCLRETVETVQRAHARNVPTFGITDSSTTPIALHCDDYLVVSTSSPSFTGSYVAPMALLNTIIVACAHLRPKRALAMLSRTEQEYRTGTRWYQDPLRRSRAGSNGQQKVRTKPRLKK
jgi:DNA-binding MurR/RpiR family transcriptional regulator